jgi:hypothetical protein
MQNSANHAAVLTRVPCSGWVVAVGEVKVRRVRTVNRNELIENS